MKLLNVFPFKPGDLVVQTPVSNGWNPAYYVTGCKYDRYQGCGLAIALVSIANGEGRKAFGTFPCSWFVKETACETVE